MSAQSNSSSGGIGFMGVLTILFVALKLTHNIDWSWWWVLSPIWGTVALAFIVLLVAAAISGRNDSRRRRRG